MALYFKFLEAFGEGGPGSGPQKGGGKAAPKSKEPKSKEPKYKPFDELHRRDPKQVSAEWDAKHGAEYAKLKADYDKALDSDDSSQVALARDKMDKLGSTKRQAHEDNYRQFKKRGKAGRITSGITGKTYKPIEIHPKKKESAPSPGDSKGGVITKPMWMFGGLESLAGLADQAVSKPATPIELPVTQITEPTLSGDDEIQKLIVDNPDMNAATLWNTMKSKGLTVSKKEADSSSSNVAVLKTQESFRSNVQFTESVGADTNVGVTKFKTVLIQEGLGNLKDGYYYTKEALAGAVGNGIFEGKKIYADHPARSEEQDRPERSVRDIVGHFENVKLEENESGQAMITADAVTLPDEHFNWARALMRHAVDFAKKYPDKDFVGLSINANGKAEPMEANKFLTESQVPEGSKQKLMQAIQEGLQTVRVVSALDSAVSCDLVTEAGAGGKVIQFLEGMNMEKDIEEGGPGSGPQKGGGKSGTKEPSTDSMLTRRKQVSDSTAKHSSKLDDLVRSGKGSSKLANNLKQKVAIGRDEHDRLTKTLAHKLKKKESGEEMQDEEMKQEAEPMPEEQHSDVEQDTALIKKMLSEYLGEEEVDNEEAFSHAKESYEAYQEMGMEKEEAMKQAGQVMKLAKHMASKKMKQAEEPSEEMPSEEQKESDDKDADDMKKESAQIAKLTGELTRLREANRKFEIGSVLDKKLEALKESRRVTDKIRELIGEPKSEAHIDSVIKSFMGGYEVVKEAKATTIDFTNMVMIEKNTKTAGTKASGFGDCLN